VLANNFVINRCLAVFVLGSERRKNTRSQHFFSFSSSAQENVELNKLVRKHVKASLPCPILF
jgi:hypothetical protein